jgi:hypothetical protein
VTDVFQTRLFSEAAVNISLIHNIRVVHKISLIPVYFVISNYFGFLNIYTDDAGMIFFAISVIYRR